MMCPMKMPAAKALYGDCTRGECAWWVKIKENCVLKEIESTLYDGFGEINGNLQVIGNELIRIADNTRRGDKQ